MSGSFRPTAAGPNLPLRKPSTAAPVTPAFPRTGLPPRGLLGNCPDDPKGGALRSATGEPVIVPSQGCIRAPPPHQTPPVHVGQMGSGPAPDMRGHPHDVHTGELQNMTGDPRGPSWMELQGSENPLTVPVCNYCSKQGNFRCVRCKKAFYCSIHCQTQDWPTHRHRCWASAADTSVTETPLESQVSAVVGETAAPVQPKLNASDDSAPQRSPTPQRTYLKDLKTHSITRGTELKGMVAEFSSPSRFFVLPQDPQVSENMQSIGAELQKTPSDEPTTTLYTPNQGEVCTVQFSMDGNWYRGLVLSVSADQKTASVLYVDFGNEEDVPIDGNMIKPLPVNLQALPPCVLECCLSGVEPVAGSWTRECCMVVKQVMSGKCLPVSVMDTSENGHVFTVDILLSAFGKHLSTFLLDQGYAAKETKKPSEQDINKLVSASLENYKRLSNGKDENLGSQPPEPLTQCVGDSFSAVVTNLQSPQDMICQKVDNAAVIHGQQLMLREHCSQIPVNHNFRPAPGTMCCSQFSEDKQWYRAKVLAYSSEDHVCVGYIDFGTSEEVELRCLRPISPSLLALPMQAIPCALAGLRPVGEGWSDDCIQALRQAVSNRMVRVEILGKRDGTALVAMMDESSDPQADVAELLLTLRLASPLGTDQQLDAHSHAYDAETGVEAQHAAAPIEARSGTTPVEEPCAATPAEACMAVTPVGAHATATPAEARKAATPAEARTASTPAEARTAVTPVGAHATARPIGAHAAAAPVEARTAAAPVEARMAAAPVEARMAAAPVEARMAAAPVEARMAAAPIEARTAAAPVKARMAAAPVEARMAAAPVEARAAAAPVEARMAAAPVEAHVAAAPVEVRVAATPVESPCAAAGPEAPPLLWYCAELPSDGQAVAVVSSVVENPGEFYCYLYNPEDLQKLMNLRTELHQHCEAESATFRPRAGEPCCAMFSGDGAWYRAMVVGVFEDKVEVFFVDYGNSSLVENIYLRTITPQLLTLPFQAIRCSLAGVQPVGPEWSSEAILRFQSLMMVEDLKARVVSMSECGYEVELETAGHSVAAALILDQLATVPPAAAPQESCGSSVTVAPEMDVSRETNQSLAPPITQDVAPPITQDVAPPITQDVAPPPDSTSPPAPPAGCFPVDWKAGELPLNEVFQPRVAAIISPSLFYLHAPSQIGMEELQQVMMELAVYGSANQGLGQGQTPAVGAACCARFTGDDNWYRAVVLETADSGVTVLYADYGNTETLPYSSILPIPPHLLQVPVQIAHCALSGKEGFPSVWPAEEVAMFKTLLSEGVSASVERRDDSVHLLSVTLPPHMGGGHLNTLMLNALQPRAETPPPPPRAEVAPEPQLAHAGASGQSPTPSATPIEPEQPAGSTDATADATGFPVEPELLSGSADVTGSMPEEAELAVAGDAAQKTAEQMTPQGSPPTECKGADRPVCCCVELKTKMAHLEQLMEMQLCLLTRLEKQVAKHF